MREYAVDPLEALFVRDVMRTDVLTLDPARAVSDLPDVLEERDGRARQRLFPVVGKDHVLEGVVGHREISAALRDPAFAGMQARDIMRRAEVAYGDETLRAAADRMTLTRLWVLPVVDRGDPQRLLGLIAQHDLTRARDRLLVEERHRERVLRLRRVPIMTRRARTRREDPPSAA